MSKKRKCRYTPEETAIHEEAVRLRRMTDRQLVEAFHKAGATEVAPSAEKSRRSVRRIVGQQEIPPR